MPRYWVVSTNIGNETKKSLILRFWIENVLKNKSIYMGSPSTNKNGLTFAKIAPGDLVLIAHGSMAEHGIHRRLVACGKVSKTFSKRDARVDDSSLKNRHSQYATLDPFVELDEDPLDCGIVFNSTRHDGNPQPRAVFELVPDSAKYPGNRALCDWLRKTLSKKTPKEPEAVVIANLVSVAEANTEEHQVKTKKEMTIALHREEELVSNFVALLRKKGRLVKRIRYRTGTIFFCDAYEPARKHLIEAKASATREDIRMAIGQLFDYDRLTRAAGMGESQLAVLLPSRPDPDVEQLLDSLRIAAIWRKDKKFADNRKSKFI